MAVLHIDTALAPCVQLGAVIAFCSNLSKQGCCDREMFCLYPALFDGRDRQSGHVDGEEAVRRENGQGNPNCHTSRKAGPESHGTLIRVGRIASFEHREPLNKAE